MGGTDSSSVFGRSTQESRVGGSVRPMVGAPCKVSDVSLVEADPLQVRGVPPSDPLQVRAARVRAGQMWVSSGPQLLCLR